MPQPRDFCFSGILKNMVVLSPLKLLKLWGTYHSRCCIVCTISNLTDVTAIGVAIVSTLCRIIDLREFRHPTKVVLPPWRLLKLCGTYHCRVCIIFTLSNFVGDVFQGFKIHKKWKTNYGGVTAKEDTQTLWDISLSRLYCIYTIQLRRICFPRV